MRPTVGELYSSTIKEKFTKKLYAVYAVVILFLVFLFRKIGSAEMLEFMKQVNLFYVLLAGILLIVAVVVRAYRLHLMLLKVKKIKWENILLTQIISQTISIYTTGLAESVKALPLKKLEGIPVKKTMEVFVLEKTLDTFVNFAILILALPHLEEFFPSLAGQLLKISVILLIGIILAGFYLFQTRYKKIELSYAMFVLGVTFGNALIKLGAFYLLLIALGINFTAPLLFAIYAILSIIPIIAVVPFGLGVKEPLVIFVASVTVGLAESSAFMILANLVVFASYTLLSAVTILIYSRKNDKQRTEGTAKVPNLQQ